MKIYAYLRVSTSQQEESGAGKAAQLKSCQDWARAKKETIEKVFTEKAISGSAPLEKRKALKNAIEALKKDDVLLVAKRDRLGRDILNLNLIESLVEKKEAKIISCAGEGTDSTRSSDKLIRSVIDAISEFERNRIRERTREALATKIAKNERTGRIPFGFKLSEDGIHIEVCEIEKETLLMIGRLRWSGMKLREIAGAMNETEFLNRGRKWRISSIHNMLKKTQIKF